MSGYYAHGWSSNKNYYKADLTYSFNKKDYLPREFPKRTLSFISTYDVMSPSDKFVNTDKDNVFTAFKWATVDKMMFYNQQQLKFEWEEEWGMSYTVTLKMEGNEAAGRMNFQHLSDIAAGAPTLSEQLAAMSNYAAGDFLHNGKMRTTELGVRLQLAPGRTYINTKQRRLPINLDAPVFTLGHTMGQWNTVPYPLLCMPAANLSYILEDETFNLVNNMEFLNDRYLSADVSWDLNGKIFNRIPLLKKLKWREYIGAKMLWGKLTNKNNPYLEQNHNSNVLMEFPEGCYVMEPYFEIVAGVHNIFKLLHVEYVRRLNYNELPTARKHGIRFMVRLTF